jgi:uncharacterized protein (DUF58 family)
MLSLIVLGMITLNGDLVALALPLLVVLALGVADIPAPLNLHATRTISPDRVAQGQPIEVRIQLRNTGPRLHNLRIVDQLPRGLRLLDGEQECLLTLGMDEGTELSYRVQGDRGMYAFGTIQAVAQDRLGLFRRAVTVEAPGRLFVMPELLRLRQVNIRPRRTKVYSGSIPARQGGAGVEFFGVRTYQPGDPLRRVNPRATARHDQALFVNEFEQERVADIGIILDARARSDIAQASGSLFEHGVQAAAALSDALITQGNRVGLLVYGDSIDWTLPGYGKVQRERILRALAVARPGDRLALETLDALPTRLFPLRSLLLMITPLLPEDIKPLAGLRRRGYQLSVISPDPISFEQPSLAGGQSAELGARMAGIERALLLRRLAQAGVPVFNWPVTTPFPIIAARVLGRRGP